jgi:hypothetical protein
VAAFESWNVGKPDDPGLLQNMPFVYGALTNIDQLERVQQHVEEAKEDGVR